VAHHDYDYEALHRNRPSLELIASAAMPIGQPVYARVGEDKGIVTGYIVRADHLTYLITWTDHAETSHYAFEVSTSPYGGGADEG
jgi:hypothetical protein